MPDQDFEAPRAYSRTGDGVNGMAALRQLSAVYVAAAGAYSIAMALSAHPDWSRTAENTAHFARVHAVATAADFERHVLRPDLAMVEAAGRSVENRIAAELRGSPRTQTPQRKIAHANIPARPTMVARIAPPPPPDDIAPPPEAAPTVPTPPPAALRGSENAPRPETEPNAAVPPRQITLAPQAPIPQASNPQTNVAPPDAVASLPPQGAPDAGEIIRVEDRLKASLTSEMVDNFELFLYVSKAESGPWAQRMYVFQKQPSGDLTLLYNWPVSTGREKVEFNPEGHRLKTATPPGYYELDPHRSYEHYVSGEWGQPMPYAMFFNWVKDGNQTGLAIHAASGDDVARLGQRASAGCIHLSEDNARALFTMIRSQYKGLAPRFAMDRRTGTMSNQGILLHDAGGNLKMAEGYKVLVFIEDYGGENLVAALF